MSTTTAPQTSAARLWTGRILSALPSAMLLFAAGMAISKSPQVVEDMTKMGYPASSITFIGITALLGVVLYWIPHTAVVGAALITGYLGGAVATHVHHGDPIPMIAAPVVFGIVIWTGLVLRDPRLDVVLPWKR